MRERRSGTDPYRPKVAAMTTPSADLEIRLSSHPSGGYGVGLRFSRSDSEALVETEAEAPVAFDFEALTAAEGTPQYGRLLTDSLFAGGVVGRKFTEAAAIADTLKTPLRVRLFVSRGAPRLDALRWETLRHPDDDTPLASSERVLFSRYLSSADWGSVRRQSRRELTALVAIANPTKDAAAWRLAEIDVDGELERARTALGPEIPTTNVLPPLTLDTLTEHVRAHKPDLLYLVCHGGRRQGDDVPILYLEDEERAVKVVTAAELAEQLDILEQRLQVVVLASCRSAGGQVVAGSDGALAALGPLLAAAGVPAVVAMQGDITMETVKQFMPKFFAELREHGEIDRAMARARNLVRERQDAWMPVLFLRLKSGLWYVPGFAGEQPGFEKWPSLLAAIERGQCVPILGSGLADGVFGSRREIARRWAEAYRFPLAPHDRDDLPQVAQFLTVTQGWGATIYTLEKQIKTSLLRRYRGEPPPELTAADATLSSMSEAVGRQQRESNETDPHRVLAGLSLPIYVTTNPDNLLRDALRDAGKTPRVELFRWSADPDIVWPPSMADPASETYDPAYRPSPQEPLVYHLFGNLDHPDTLVLTEDHYFDFLKRAGDAEKVRDSAVLDPNAFRSDVRAALARSALLFVGFQMDDWDFRMLFRSDFINREGGRARRDYFNVGVQVSPEEGRFLEIEAARDYLDSYLNSEAARISIFWGNAEDFAAELARRLAVPGRDAA
jgi:hypothetical protein